MTGCISIPAAGGLKVPRPQTDVYSKSVGGEFTNTTKVPVPHTLKVQPGMNEMADLEKKRLCRH